MPVAQALALVMRDAAPLAPEAAPLAQAHGRVLADDLGALRTQPPDDISAMDGYAVRAEDVATAPASLKVIGEVAAGRPFDGAVGAGEAARIFTGGVLPAGADTVVIQENTCRDGDRVVGKARGLSDPDLALAAAMNHPALPVHRAPKVAVLATGDELVMPGAAPSA